jgi:hypothetical protein
MRGKNPRLEKNDKTFPVRGMLLLKKRRRKAGE